MKKPSLIMIALMVLTASASGQTTRPTTPTQIAEAFLNRVGKGEFGPAYDQLFVGSPMMMAQPTQIDLLKRQTDALIPLYGKILGFELYEERKFGQSVIELVYIQRLEKHPLIWKVWFYRPTDDWQVSGVNFNDQLNFQ